jgi:hypothetical protein
MPAMHKKKKKLIKINNNTKIARMQRIFLQEFFCLGKINLNFTNGDLFIILGKFIKHKWKNFWW